MKLSYTDFRNVVRLVSCHLKRLFQAQGIDSVVEHVFGVCKALSSSPSDGDDDSRLSVISISVSQKHIEPLHTTRVFSAQSDYVVCFQPLPVPPDRSYDSGPRNSTASLRSSNLSSVEISLFRSVPHF